MVATAAPMLGVEMVLAANLKRWTQKDQKNSFPQTQHNAWQKLYDEPPAIEKCAEKNWTTHSTNVVFFFVLSHAVYVDKRMNFGASSNYDEKYNNKNKNKLVYIWRKREADKRNYCFTRSENERNTVKETGQKLRQ